MWSGLEQSLIDDAIELTNGQDAGVPVADISNILYDYQFVFSEIDELHVSHHA